ncbi:nuclear transport factor 2 family protein [Actinoplanes sp. NPDC049802]|uniref:nuclear transport factor 2 family protein n=1 Tax=Actinoplanes sp. NPDC049802 TaxID=3154742 RepID=UPI0033E1D1C2
MHGHEQALQQCDEIGGGDVRAHGARGLSARRSPHDVVEQVRRMVAGENVVFADLFAEDGVLEYPFALPGQPHQLRGREAIRAFFGNTPGSRRLFEMDGVDALVRDTGDPEVVVTEIEHYGRSTGTGEAYRFRALGVIRVRDGEIVSYQDYMDPIATARLLGRTADLAAALADA